MPNTIITIFIPVYNGEGLLRRTLDTVLAQTYGDWELVAVDDSSTDGSFALLQEYAARDSRIRLFRKSNGGDVPHAWQYAMPLFKGEWVLYMSQDDRLAPDTLQLLAERQRETEADVVFPHEVHYVEGMPLDKMHHLRGVAGDTTRILTGLEAFRLMIDYSITGRGLWRTSIIRECGIRTDTFNADELAQREWVLACRTVAFSDAMFYYCRGNAISITEQHSALHYDECLTNSHLLQLAEKHLHAGTPMLQAMASAYYDHLLYMSIMYHQRGRTYSAAERRRTRNVLHQAYTILRQRVAINTSPKKITLIGMPAFSIYTRLKAIKHTFNNNHLTDNYDIDIHRYLLQ